MYKGGAVLVTGLFSAYAYIYASARTLVLTGGAGAGTGGGAGVLHAPPPITTHSDERSVRLAGELQVRWCLGLGVEGLVFCGRERCGGWMDGSFVALLAYI